MSRPIKFRCFDTSKKIMVLGCSHLQRNGLEVMEFTGLNDKNGTEIYEGDVVKAVDDRRRFGNLQIVFRSGQFLPDGSQWSLAGFVSNFGCEVVGNVYEDPELLTRKEGDA